MISDSLDFMNKYHAGEADGINIAEYMDRLSGFDEHLEFYKTEQIAGQDTETTEDDVYQKVIQRKESPKFDVSSVQFEKEYVKKMMTDSVISSPEDMLHNRFNMFNRYGYLDPTHELVTGTREYLFFSKPDLHLINPNDCSLMYDVLYNTSPFFREAFKTYKLSYYSLQQTFNQTSDFVTDGLTINLNNKYINLLSNMVTSTFDLPDISASDVLNNQNLYQINTSYREGSITSDLQYDFSLEFKDTKYLDVYMLFKIYDEYFRIKYTQEILPVDMKYIMNKIYPEALSIWKIIVDDTGRIMYWAKATGCVPMSVPRSTISNIEGNIKFTVNWKAQFVRDMDPINLIELNYLTLKSLGGDTGGGNITKKILSRNDIYVMPNLVPAFNKDDLPEVNNSTWVGYPLIIGNNESAPLRTGHHTESSKNAFHRLIWIGQDKNRVYGPMPNPLFSNT